MKKILIFAFLLLHMLLGAEELKFDDLQISFALRDQKIAEELGKALRQDIDIFQKKMGHYPQLQTRIVIAQDHQEYQEFVQNSGTIQEFSQAIYRQSNNTIYIRNPRDNLKFGNLRQIILHEYIHSYVFNYFSNAPLWFHEGMAVYFSGDFGENRELGLVRNYLLGNTRPLDQMRYQYPENKLEWESFYSKSALAVRYLYIHKRAAFYSLWQNSLPHRKFNAAFLQSFKYRQDDFSNFFEEYCQTHLKSQVLLALSGMIWLIFPLIFLAGYLRRRRLMKKKLAEMEAEEREELTEINFSPKIEIDAKKD